VWEECCRCCRAIRPAINPAMFPLTSQFSCPNHTDDGARSFAVSCVNLSASITTQGGSPMPRRKTIFKAGGRYHVCNRGNNSQKMFSMCEDYLQFLDRLNEYLPVAVVTFHTICLLPNHFHLSLKLNESFDLSSAMKVVQNSYARSFNMKYGRHGHLYDSRFKSTEIESEEYLDYLSRYIHRNPVKARLVHKPEDWEFSSYRCYVNDETPALCKNFGREMHPTTTFGPKTPTIDTSTILARFRTKEDYRKFVLCDWKRAPWKLEDGIWRPSKDGMSAGI